MSNKLLLELIPILQLLVCYSPQTKFGQGNMFTGVCLSTGGCLVPGGSGPRGALSLGGTSSQGGLLWGVPYLGRGLVPGVHAPGDAWWQPPRWLLLWVVCILLECILVINQSPEACDISITSHD